MISSNKIIRIIIVLGSFFSLTACDSNQPVKDLQAYIDKLHAAKATVAANDKDASKNLRQLEPIQYNAESRRSPFEVIDVTPNKGSMESNPLQAYPLDMLRFVGTVTKSGKTSAFIAAPDNKIYQVKEGDIMGDRNGKIISIEADRISLVEQGTAPEQEAMKQVVTLQLKEASP